MADSAGAEKGVADDIQESGTKFFEGKGSWVWGYDTEKGGTADSGHNGDAMGWRRMLEHVDDEDILLRNSNDADKGFGGGVEDEAQHHGMGVSERFGNVRWSEALKGLNDTDTKRESACGEGGGEKKTSLNTVGMIGGRGGAVGVWVECERLETAGVDVAKKGSVRKIGSCERENREWGLGEKKVGYGLVATEIEKVVKKQVTLKRRGDFECGWRGDEIAHVDVVFLWNGDWRENFDSGDNGVSTIECRRRKRACATNVRTG